MLLWSVVTFTINPFETGQVEALPVDIISDADFTKITAGVKTAPKVETPKPLVEKIDQAKPTDEVTPNVTEKQEIKTASAMPVPIPEMRPPRPKPERPRPSRSQSPIRSPKR